MNGDESLGAAGDLSEEELRARLEEELKRIKVADVLLQTVVTLINLAGQRLGLAEGTREERDLGQIRVAIEAVRSLLPLLEEDEQAARQMRPIRDALSQLQLAYAQEVEGGGAPGPGPGPEGGPEPGPSGPGPAPERPGPAPGARRPGRLWVPPGSAG
jgi:hypothetical protein